MKGDKHDSNSPTFAFTTFVVGCVAFPTENESVVIARSDGQITGSEVTDRTTLREFVKGAKSYQEGITTVTGIARLRDVYRAEGRWKSGSLFLITLTRDGYILIHGN